MSNRAFAGNDRSAARWFAQQPNWWVDHFVGAVQQIEEFLAGDGLTLAGRSVLDVGCGDGTISLGLKRKGGAANVVGVDLVDVDRGFLNTMARANGETELDDHEDVAFLRSEPGSIPTADATFDIAIAWSVFEHVDDPVRLLAEIRRTLKPSGLLFLQIWPLYHSEHGSHLWPWFEQPFVQLRLGEDQIREELRERIDAPELADAMFDLYRSCNRVTVDQLQSAVLDAGLFVAKVSLDSPAIHVPSELQRVPLSKLAVAELKVLAVRVS